MDSFCDPLYPSSASCKAVLQLWPTELDQQGLEPLSLGFSDPVLMLCRISRTQQPPDNRAEPQAARLRLTFSPNQSASRGRYQTPIRASLSEVPKNALVNLHELRTSLKPDHSRLARSLLTGVPHIH